MHNRPWPWIVAIYAVLLLFVGCSTSEVKPPAPAPLVSLSVAPVNSSIAPGTTVQFTATGTFADNTKRNVTASVTWDSSDTGIATISNALGSQGLVTAATSTNGSTIIKAASGSITGSTTLTTSHVASIIVTPTNPSCIARGTTQQFSAAGTLSDNNVQNLTIFATWTSSDPSITVGDTPGLKGLATAVSVPGTANIQATYNTITGSTALTSSAVASIATTPTSTSIPKGTNQQFTATGTLSGCTNTQDLTTSAIWSSSSTTVATISNTGLATAVDVGSTDISAMFDLVTSPTSTLTVTQAVLVSIAVTPANQSIAVGQTQPFTAIGIFSGGTTTLDITSSVTWTSSNTGIATISNTSGKKGLAVAVAEGTTTVTAGFSGITSNVATLTVTPAKLVSITVSPASADISLASSTTKQFSATGTFTDGSTQNLTTSVVWNSSDTFVATISNISGFQGLATASNIAQLPASTNITATLSGITSNAAILTVTF